MGNKVKDEGNKYLTIEEWGDFIIQEDKSIYSLLWKVILACGLRIQEALILQGQDIDYKRKVVSVRTLKRSKKKVLEDGTIEKSRPMPRFDKDLPEDLLNEIKSLTKGKEDVIFTYRGKHISYLKAWRRFKTIAKRAKLSDRLSPHSLRHLYGMMICEHTNGNAILIAKALRHSSTDSALFYTHLDPKKRKELSEAAWESFKI